MPPTISRLRCSSSAIRRYRSRSSALWWVTNGRAVAPPWMLCSTGPSTSTKPRSARCSRMRPDGGVPDPEDLAGALVGLQVRGSAAGSGSRRRSARGACRAARPAPCPAGRATPRPPTARPVGWSSPCPRRPTQSPRSRSSNARVRRGTHAGGVDEQLDRPRPVAQGGEGEPARGGGPAPAGPRRGRGPRSACREAGPAARRGPGAASGRWEAVGLVDTRGRAAPAAGVAGARAGRPSAPRRPTPRGRHAARAGGHRDRAPRARLGGPRGGRCRSSAARLTTATTAVPISEPWPSQRVCRTTAPTNAPTNRRIS